MNNSADMKENMGSFVEVKDIKLSIKSRFRLLFMRLAHKTMLGIILRAKDTRIAWFQIKVASLALPKINGLAIKYDFVGKSPGHTFGNIKDRTRPVVLWLHGGAFVLPASPTAHHPFMAKLCQQLSANGFMPDYRLAPFNPFPFGLNDCEQAYKELLEMGYSPSKIVLGGDSAGGNLVFGLLQRIRKSGLAMPACAIAVSPPTELGRAHGPPSRPKNAKCDALIPVTSSPRVWQLYGTNQDSANPEISPLYMDCHDLPPLFFVAGNHEMLRDDTLMLAKRCNEAGISTTCHIWPSLPHAFPLFTGVFEEAEQSFVDLTLFANEQLLKANQE